MTTTLARSVKTGWRIALQVRAKMAALVLKSLAATDVTVRLVLLVRIVKQTLMIVLELTAIWDDAWTELTRFTVTVTAQPAQVNSV